MFDWVKARVLRLMRVPHEPEPPLGAPGSARIFRAGLNHYHLKVVRWFLGQAGAIVGIGFSLVSLYALEVAIDDGRLKAAQARATASPTPTVSPSPTPTPETAPSRADRRRDRDRQRDRTFARLASRLPPYVMPLIKILEVLGITFFLVQLIVTYSLVRLEFEQHWYIVTDRSLRIRTGILRLQESTMSFANIQQVEIRQGPLQRLLGLADVCVRSAGGGGDTAHAGKGHGHEESLHVGVFAGVDNAVEIRDLILHRLRAFREAGLGDPEDARATALTVQAASPHPHSASDAVAELLSEARALRRVLVEEP